MKTISILLAACACSLAVVAGCAAPGMPQPPSLRVAATVDNLSAIRKGDRVILAWSPPGETTDHQIMRWPTTTRICRAINQFPTNVCGEVVKVIQSSELATATPGTRRPLVSYEDALPPALVGAKNEATYTVEVLNERGRSAGLSNQVRVPLIATLPPPADFRATLDAQGPLLQWNALTNPAPSPDISYRLRIYRRSQGKPEFTLISELPYQVGKGEARDRNFEWEKTYDYKIASVTVLATPGRTTAEVSGADSPQVQLATHDVFPPAAPTGLQAVFSSVGQKPFIDLTWAPDTESDLAGYMVYRRSATSGFSAVTSSLVRAPAWRDNDVQPGQTYYYTVVAVDVRGNQSTQSASAEETVPVEVR